MQLLGFLYCNLLSELIFNLEQFAGFANKLSYRLISRNFIVYRAQSTI